MQPQPQLSETKISLTLLSLIDVSLPLSLTALSYLYLSLLVVGFSFACLHFSLIFRPQLTRTFRPARFSSLHLLLL